MENMVVEESFFEEDKYRNYYQGYTQLKFPYYEEDSRYILPYRRLPYEYSGQVSWPPGIEKLNNDLDKSKEYLDIMNNKERIKWEGLWKHVTHTNPSGLLKTPWYGEHNNITWFDYGLYCEYFVFNYYIRNLIKFRGYREKGIFLVLNIQMNLLHNGEYLKLYRPGRENEHYLGIAET